MIHLKKFNESIFINDKEIFLNKFKINMEDMEDYLTELSDEYDISIYQMGDHPRIRTQIISFLPIEKTHPNTFAIIIKQKSNDDDNIKGFFQPIVIMQKMETFINRIKYKYPYIKFEELNSYAYKSGLKTIEYLFRIDILKYK